MKHPRASAAGPALPTLLAILLTGCSQRIVPPPSPAPAPLGAAEPAPPAAPPRATPRPEWSLAELSPGDWAWFDAPSPRAEFGQPGRSSFVLACETPGRIRMDVAAPAAASRITIRTSFGMRSLGAGMEGGAVVARLPAGEPVLDELVFSRGRFAVEVESGPRLIVPAWPETARVIEECRGA